MLRRLEKRVLVDLPSLEARQAMFQQFLPPTVIRESNGLILFSDLDYHRLAQVKHMFLSVNESFHIGLVHSSVQKVIPVPILNSSVKKPR
jgi:SpoVK/Ycf46/Vps4 family AAA+-type ATPase